jgi:hypothetical protein
MQPSTLVWQHPTRAVTAHYQRKHAVKWHKDKAIVAVGMPSIRARVAVNLGKEAQAVRSCEAGRKARRCISGVHEARTALDRRSVTGEYQTIVTNLTSKPPDETFMGRRVGALLAK